MSILRIRATLSGWTGGPGLYTAYYSPVSEPAITADATEAVARVRAFWQATRANLNTTTSVQVNNAVDVLDEATGALIGGLTGTSVAVVTGSDAGAINEFHTMALLQLKTSTVIAGRHLMGRSNIGPLAATQVSSGLLSGSAVTTLSTAAPSLTTTISSPNAFVVWHRPKAGAGGAKGNVTGFGVPTKLAVLRSRRD